MYIKFIYEKDEFLKGIRLAMFKFKKIKIFDIIIFLIGIILSYFLSGSLGIILRIVSIIGIFFVFYQLVFYPKKLFNNNSEFREEYCLTIDEEKIILRNNGISRSYLFKEFTSIKTDKDYIYFLDNGGFLIIPKRIFVNNLDEINSIIEKNI